MNNIEVELTEQELLDTLSSIKYSFDQLSRNRVRINRCFTTLRNELIRLRRLYCYYGNVLSNRGGCYICKRKLKKENDFDGDTLCIHPVDFTVQRAVNILKNHDNTKGVITIIISDPKR